MGRILLLETCVAEGEFSGKLSEKCSREEGRDCVGNEEKLSVE
jgi:hypothetical protein